MCDPVSITLAVVGAASVATTASAQHQNSKARKSALQDADQKQQAAAKEAATIESTANEAANAKAAARAKAIKDSSTILTSPTGVAGAAATKKTKLGGV